MMQKISQKSLNVNDDLDKFFDVQNNSNLFEKEDLRDSKEKREKKIHQFAVLSIKATDEKRKQEFEKKLEKLKNNGYYNS